MLVWASDLVVAELLAFANIKALVIVILLVVAHEGVEFFHSPNNFHPIRVLTDLVRRVAADTKKRVGLLCWALPCL